MKNPFEDPTSRETYDETKERKAIVGKEKEAVDSPRLHPAYDENSDEATKAEALVNMKRSEDLGKQLNVLEARLKEIRTENEEEAYELEGEYRVLAKEAEESGDHTKLDEFEKRLRMRKGRVEKVGE